MAACIADKLWSGEDVIALIDAAQGQPEGRGPYEMKIAA